MQKRFSEITERWGKVLASFSKMSEALSVLRANQNETEVVSVPVLVAHDHGVVEGDVSEVVQAIDVEEDDLSVHSGEVPQEHVDSQPEMVVDEEAVQETINDLPIPATIEKGWDWSSMESMIDELDPVAESAPVIAAVAVPNLGPSSHDDSNKDQFVADEELIGIVVEELEELIPETDTLLQKIDTGDAKVISKLHRIVHTLKGTVGQVGAYRARSVIHDMETLMEELDSGQKVAPGHTARLLEMWGRAQEFIRPLLNGEWRNAGKQEEGASAPAVTAPKTVRVQTDVIDVMVQEVNEIRLDSMSMEENVLSFKHKLKDLEENGQRVSRMLRELELQAEMQIQSRRSQLQEVGEDFDPLEFDRFTRLQELSRLMNEGVTDILEVRRELNRALVDQETAVAHQRRAITSTQDKLHKTRLIPVDAINDRLHNVVWTSSREVGKPISFEMSGGRIELDRMFLEKIITPLDHILRNSVAHGIENVEERLSLGKPEEGVIKVSVRQEAGRAIIEVQDDGYGLRTSKIKQKAVEKGLWNPNQPMSDEQAAEMICTPSFSTADSVSQIAGRGVGMDVVRSEILALGGRFEIKSVPTKGLHITIQIPTSIATASVLVVESGGEKWAFPIEMVANVTLVGQDKLSQSRDQSRLHVEGFDEWKMCPYAPLHLLTGVHTSSSVQRATAPVLLLKERGQLMAVEVERLVQVFEVPLRHAGSIWSGVKGVAGTVILPSSEAIFLVDPFRFGSVVNGVATPSISEQPLASAPLVMVVDDSLTVRKASTRFLEKNGYETIVAKDGQEALEILQRVQPSLILMDIEMPRMDGFDCLKNIKENNKISHIPVVMVTSRTADKHRKHALDLGANGYLGKPFKETELLDLLRQYAPRHVSDL